jgi:hypothetical protein
MGDVILSGKIILKIEGKRNKRRKEVKKERK